MAKSVYLAGPIVGRTRAEANFWRAFSQEKLAEHGITAFSPLRYSEYMEGEENAVYDKARPKASPHAITARDRFDVMRSDMLLVNFCGCGDRVSIGTVIEMGWADAFRKPIVVVMESDNIHRHGILEDISMQVVWELALGLLIVRETLT